MRSRFDKTMMASVAGVCVAVAMSGCVNQGQPGQQAAVAASAVPAASAAAAAAAASDAAATASQQASAAVSAAKLKAAQPLVYRVRRGDTLSRIAQHHHCSVQNLLAWNHLKPSTRLKLGQALHVASPEAVKEANAAAAAAVAAQAAAADAAAKAAAAAKVAAAAAAGASSAASASANAAASNSANAAASPAVAASAAAAASASANPAAASAASVASAPSTDAPAPSAAETRQVDAEMSRHAKRVVLAWPAQGNVVEGFQPGATRGIEIGGKPGDPVRAAADGKVMYAGTGLNEYGSLIIVQHNKDFLTAYSHNRKLLVKTGDIVRQGQQIAEMGDENNSRVSVLFEVRRDGKPVDPMPYLPPRQG
ncbi:MAG: peptidoglycan DD-metalloendopeptidase family protein [Paraburkholderia sp.]|uniref:peptidoglycan DD-metalloendopeptidase family protein n=1 Tax=Burkholderiaceae TaxID=119060 RepID=UPI0010F98359|nr:peptidoglycan DD-metalloendopeptidase family protein [Burkholderia sp. 4M9327F10]